MSILLLLAHLITQNSAFSSRVMTSLVLKSSTNGADVHPLSLDKIQESPSPLEKEKKKSCSATRLLGFEPRTLISRSLFGSLLESLQNSLTHFQNIDLYKTYMFACQQEIGLNKRLLVTFTSLFALYSTLQVNHSKLISFL